jgi:hypothetical protein
VQLENKGFGDKVNVKVIISCWKALQARKHTGSRDDRIRSREMDDRLSNRIERYKGLPEADCERLIYTHKVRLS